MGVNQQSDATNLDRRKQIRRLAAEMFFERGYEATTMRELAAAIDIKTASLYCYSPIKSRSCST